MAATGLGFAAAHDFWPLLVIALVGTLNPSSGDVSVFLPLEHAVLVARRRRPRAHGRRSRATAWSAPLRRRRRRAGGGACPPALAAATGVAARAPRCRRCSCSTRLLGVAGGARLPRPARRAAQWTRRRRSRRCANRSARSTRWRRCSASTRSAAASSSSRCSRCGSTSASACRWPRPASLFFWTGVLSAFSYLVAVRIADRIGLVNTMVFTHLPANLCLIAIPFVPDAGPRHRAAARAQRAVADGRADAQLLRDGDRDAGGAPGRGERHRRAAQPRVGREPVARRLAAQRLSPFGWPLLAAGGVKIVYDLLLLAYFGKVRPPEEVP